METASQHSWIETFLIKNILKRVLGQHNEEEALDSVWQGQRRLHGGSDPKKVFEGD